jgi:proteasome lid subunit RPN8/RPN11
MSEVRLRIQRSDLDRIIDALRDAYPLEGCGLLIGARDPDFNVSDAWPVKNVETEIPERHYQIDPQTFLTLDARARGTGREVIGVYHSHPGEAPIPSSTDIELAWPELIYLIVGLEADGETSGEATYRAHLKTGNHDAMREVGLDVV